MSPEPRATSELVVNGWTFNFEWTIPLTFFFQSSLVNDSWKPSFSVTFSSCEGLFLGSLKSVIGYMFTSDKWVGCTDISMVICIYCYGATAIHNPKISSVIKEDRRPGVPSAQCLLLPSVIWWPCGESNSSSRVLSNIYLQTAEWRRHICQILHLFSPPS